MAKRKKKRRRRGTLLLIAIALLIAGFIVRRTLVPQFLHYLAYRPAENPPSGEVTAPPVEGGSSPASAQPSVASAATPSARKTTPAPSEHLSESDRQQLEDILKHKHR